jgi:hypothetical protein
MLNKVSPTPNVYRAQLVTAGSKTEEDLIDYMIDRGSTVTRAEAKAMLEEYGAAIIFFIKQGFTINTDLFKLAPSISGVFTDKNDSFDASRHQVNINALVGARMDNVPQMIKLEKISRTPSSPFPEDLLDVTSNTENSTLTPGGTVKLTGKDMKINPEVPEQGIYLVNGVKTTKVATFITTRPSELVFVLPATLTKGDYTLEVRGEINNVARTGILVAILKVK